MAPKKNKQVTLDLGEFLSQHAQNEGPSNWGDDELELPSTFTTAAGPRGGAGMGSVGWSSGGFVTESAPIPDAPPFTARISNVAYDVTEEALGTFFETENGLEIESMRLPKGMDGRVRAAYIDFASRDALVKAIALSGQQLLGRSLAVSVAEQKGPRMGGGGFGGPEFDWTKRAAPSDFGPPPPMGGDRGFRHREPMPEPDWGQRTGPLAPLDGPGPRRAPRGPEPEFDWSQRSGPIAPAHPPREPRAPRAPEPEYDWSQRRKPAGPARAPREPREHREHREPKEPELDWSKPRKGPLIGAKGAGASARPTPAAAAPAPAPAPAPAAAPAAAAAPASAAKSRGARAQQLTQGFKALDLDDESDSEPETPAGEPAAAQPAAQPESLASIQKAQREAENGQWSTA